MFFKTIEDETYSDISIPSIFFDMFMPIASGDQVKIYLLAYREAYFNNGLNRGDLTNEVIASTLGISEQEVVEAWRFWENMGAVKIHSIDGKMLVEFLDIKADHIRTLIRDKKDGHQDSLDSTVNEVSSIEYVSMYNRIEDLAGRILTPNEKIDLLDASKKYNMSPQLVVEAFERSIADHGKIKSVNYIIGILRSWFDQSITSLEDLSFQDNLRWERLENYKAVFKALGFNRTATAGEKEAIDRWFYDYKMPLDLVLRACHKSINTSNPNIKYFDSIIRSWHSKGISTIEDLERDEEEFAKSKKNKTRHSKKPGTKAGTLTKFHNFTQNISDKYSDDEINKLVREINKNR